MSRHRNLTGSALHIARSNRAAGIPTTTLIPSIVGEFYLNSSTTPESLWIATGLTAADWLQLTGPGVLTAAAGQLISFPTHMDSDFPALPTIPIRSTMLHYPGWSGVDTFHDGNNTADRVPIFGREQDATSLDRTTFVQYQSNAEDGPTIQANLHCAVPQGFSQFGTQGLTFRHRVAFSGGGGPPTTDDITITLNVFDPDNAAEVVAASIVRVRNNGAGQGDDAGYVELTVTQASLNAVGFTAGDLLRLQILGNPGNFEDVTAITLKFGRLLVDFE